MMSAFFNFLQIEFGKYSDHETCSAGRTYQMESAVNILMQ